ncbi:SDR family NAD(P)-dependent oxidoreductase [Chryseobacterium sp. CBSDS_008]|uniref:SDR family NAD(P)-dependent oxidoreductase n=1 Tax=Chryseobacterium sp. CBSDS_008 TaxID=3415265 RepID=UPI003CF510D8
MNFKTFNEHESHSNSAGRQIVKNNQINVEEILKEIIGEILNISSASINTALPFLEYGLRGQAAEVFTNHINERLNIQLKLVDLFNYPTILSLSNVISQGNFAEKALREEAQKLSLSPNNNGDLIAIIGMSGKFGSADSVDKFYDILKNGESLIEEVPENRWNSSECYTSRNNDDAQKTYSKWGSFLKDIDKFDPAFFHISGRDAEVMDPQQRMFLEETWKAIEDAGIDSDQLKNLRCSVFATCGLSDYEGAKSPEASSWWGNDPAIFAARMSYFLDIKGPAISVDTACSSSLTAIHLACNSLKSGESDISITGGAWVQSGSSFYKKASRAKMLSADGQCYTFDTRANGFVPGEAVGVIILKRLEDAEKDGDRIHGIIRGTYINQDGSTNGITAPSGLAQLNLLKDAFKKFSVNPQTIGCVEAHGTGTRLGDPIEFEALDTAFKSFTTEKKFCSLGSVKTNMGHAVMAAGISGVIKMVLAMKNQLLFPTLNFQTPNKLIDLDNSPFKIQNSLETWSHHGNEPRRSTVSGFGFSGTNVVVILEEYQKLPKNIFIEGPALIILSAKTQDQLKLIIENLRAHLENFPQTHLHDVAYTLQTGRKVMEEKFYFVAESISDLKYQLEQEINFSKSTYYTHLTDKQIRAAFTNKNWNMIGEAWLAGQKINWQELYVENRPSKISLPSYPFTKNSYWFVSEKIAKTQLLHPLIHINTSDFSGQQFTSSFNGKEFFFCDHKIHGHPILPGVAYLEVARAAATLSQEKKIVGVRNVNWISPIAGDEKEIEIKISLKQNGPDIYYTMESGNGNDKLKSNGILFSEKQIADPVDLAYLKTQFSSGWNKETCYTNFKSIGLDYGTAFKGIEFLFMKESEALAQIYMPSVKDIQWNVGALDSVLQCCLGLMVSDGKRNLTLPFHLGEMILYYELPEKFWCHVEKQNKSHNDKLTVFDIVLLTEEGVVIGSLKNLKLAQVEALVLPNNATETIESVSNTKSPSIQSQHATLKELVTDLIRQFVAEIVKFEKKSIKADKDFMSFGFDSNMLVRLSSELNNFYGIQLTPALFYTYTSINELVDFLLEDHSAELQNQHGIIESSTEGHTVPLENEIKSSPSFKETIAEYDDNAIAIVGISGRFPGSENLEDFWLKLCNKENMISEIPQDRWDWKAIHGDPMVDSSKTTAKWGGFISDIDKFDALFFGISPAEAALMDPQQRIFIEAVYTALEDGGIKPSDLKGTNTGVFVGAWTNDYGMLLQESEDLYLQGHIASGTMHSILANRISYLLDIHGPSEPIDTACSSALIAIHRAAESIRSGKCTMAIAGGVNALLSPETTLCISNAGMLSDDGNCKSFDISADGYVRSEGVGVIILKTLREAQKDNDQIYAIIRASAENHGGSANTLTSPNPLAQRDLLLKAYRSAGVDPSMVTYIEAHGTGTSLGDPIETEGLKMAFDILYKEWNKTAPVKANCGIGTVKANIGHLESASGVAGVIKVLLAMKYRMLPGNPLLQKPNPYLRLDDSPFYLQKDTSPWLPENNVPRVAGISSFGFGGVNAHIVLEEYRPKYDNSMRISGKKIVPLSAKNTSQLQKYASGLLSYLELNPELNFHDVAYTLQIGREPMEERMAVIAENLQELCHYLGNFLNKDYSNIFIAFENKGAEIFEDHIIISSNINGDQLKNVAQLWVDGADVDWKKHYSQVFPSKLSLPTYPFDRKRHWFQAYQSKEKTHSVSFSHPMLQHNNSTEEFSDFSFRFTGTEYYLKDHQVEGRVLFPAAAYLEMMYMTLRKTAQAEAFEITDGKWLLPLYAQPEAADLSLTINNYSNKCNIQSPVGIHFEGKIDVKEVLSFTEKKKIHELQEKLSFQQEGQSYYSMLNQYGLQYGPDYQGIKKIYYDRDVVLAEINHEHRSEFFIDPALLDSALHSVVAALIRDNDCKMLVPSGARLIKIYNAFPSKIWSYAKRNKSHQSVYSFDITVTDQDGNILAEFFELILLPLNKKETVNKTMIEQNQTYTRMYNYTWRPKPFSDRKGTSSIFHEVIILGAINERIAHLIKEEMDTEATLVQEKNAEDIFILLLEKVKKIKKGKIALIYDYRDYTQYAYLSGLLKTLRLENPYVSGTIIGIEDLQSTDDFNSILNNLMQEQAVDTEVMYSKGFRFVKQLIPLQNDILSASLAKTGGVYLVTGGAGGIGRIVAEYLAQTEGVEIVTVGRTPASKLQTSKPNIHYFSCDISKKAEVAALMKTIKLKFGKLTGIIHAAGVVRDSYIVNKTRSEVHDVYTPKVEGLKNLDHETIDEDLDFFILMSSISSVAGNTGQADYSSANAWMDNFASYRNDLTVKGLRSGDTISINWPLWAEGGMQITEETAEILYKKWGMLPMPSSEGIQAMEAILSYNNISQAVAIYGDKDFLPDGDVIYEEKAHHLTNTSISDDNALVKTKVSDHVLTLIAEILNYEKEELSTDSALSQYGFSSYLLVKFSNTLNTYYDINEPPSIFYSYQTIDELVNFLWEVHRDKLTARHEDHSNVNIEENESSGTIDKSLFVHHESPITERETDVKDIAETPVIMHDIRRIPGNVKEKETQNIEKHSNDVAVVGVAGRFPNAENIEEFWELLHNNEDVITEIPESRWDWNKYYGTPGEDLTKTNAKWGGFISDIDKFDAEYFNINPKEAELMDPQQRIVLETVHTALEDAGIAPSSLKGSNTGVFIGIMNNDYAVMLRRTPAVANQAYTAIGNTNSILANRISFLLGLHGPSEPVKTACSSSLIAIHRAAQKIKNGDCDVAIAGGVNAIMIPDTTLMISNAGMLSKDGRCMSFDQRANGYVRSEGVGIVILKSLEKAKEDGDLIYGVIRGSAENHGGKASSLTAPNPKAQRDLLVEAYRAADVHPSEVSYIEAHGTGTALGDPIEIEGLKMAFETLYKDKAAVRPATAFCAIGSAKANIGHTESASGVAGLIKVLMAFKYRTLPGNPQLKIPNPHLKLNNSPFYLQNQTSPWSVDSDSLRVAGISSFGFGGANAHIVLQEYNSIRDKAIEDGPAAIVLSAKNKQRLKEYTQKLKRYIVSDASLNIHDIAYTLQTGREFLEERIGWIAKDIQELIEQMESYIKGNEPLYSGNTTQNKSSLKILNEAFNDQKKITLLKEENYNELLSLWCIGVSINWKQLYAGKKVTKIRLPTYPFERKSFWFSNTYSERAKDGMSQHGMSTSLTEKLREIVADTVKKPINAIQINDDFFDFGLDSISGSELIRKINIELKMKIDFPVLYTYTTIEHLAEFLKQAISISE